MSENTRKLISIVVPVFNEEETVDALYEAVCPLMADLADRYDCELVFTDNHSADRTFEKLGHLAASDNRVRVFRFSRNFGYQRSVLTGYLKARGDAVVQLDCDLQDPPELIKEFVRLWQEGNDVVYGVRRTRQENPFVEKIRKAFYRIANWLSEDDLPLDAGDFRLVDRKIINVLRQMEDAQPYLRGAIAAMGFAQTGVPYERRRRQRGTSKFSTDKMIELAVDGILNHSVVPLRVATFIGLAVSMLTGLCIVGYLARKVFFGADWPAGFATLVLLLFGGIGLNALFLGILGEYLGRIYKQVKRRPLTIIEASIEPQPDPQQTSLHEGQ